MFLTLLFLVSCVIIARKFEKHNLRTASIAYSVMFVVILLALLFTVEIPVVRSGLANMVGRYAYANIHYTLCEAMNHAYYGVSVAAVMAVSFWLQVIFTAVDTAAAVVKYVLSKKDIHEISKKAYLKLQESIQSLIMPRPINLLCCRMLN